MQSRWFSRVTLAATFLAIVAVAVSCGGRNSSSVVPKQASSAQATQTRTPVPTVMPSPAPEQQVLAAYARYWDVYSRGILELDPSHFEEVMTGPRLERARGEIDALRAQHHAVRIVVTNHPIVAAVNLGQAVVLDEYTNQSVVIDSSTGQPIGDPGQPQTIRDSFTLMLVGGIWKVSDVLRQAGR
jgi:hypothetical protein